MGALVAVLPEIATAASVASGVVSAVGAISSASAQQKQAEYQAAVARNNQTLAENAAKEALQAGQTREANARMASAQLRSRQRAVLASNGVDVNSGSALDTQTDTAALGELDALTIRSNAERDAVGYRNQGANFGGEAALAAARAANATTSGYFSAGGSLLTSAGNVAQKWYQFKKQDVAGWA